MSLVGKVRGEVEKTRHLQELTRRDETKLPDQAGGFSVYQITEADCFQDDAAGVGWYPGGPPYPHLVRQGVFVHFFGMFEWFQPDDMGAYPYGPSFVVRPDNIPAEFHPASRRVISGHGPGFTNDRLWVLYILANPSYFLQLGDAHSGFAWTYPFADIDDGDNKVLTLSATYVVEPDANTYPA